MAYKLSGKICFKHRINLGDSRKNNHENFDKIEKSKNQKEKITSTVPVWKHEFMQNIWDKINRLYSLGG